MEGKADTSMWELDKPARYQMTSLEVQGGAQASELWLVCMMLMERRKTTGLHAALHSTVPGTTASVSLPGPLEMQRPAPSRPCES